MNDALDRDRMLEEMGISPRWVLRDPAAVVRSADVGTGVQPLTASALAEPTPAPEKSNAPEERASVVEMDWDSLRQSIKSCQSCNLCAGRKQAVPGVGDENASWLFIGEGPGAEEDARGEPFVGQAGKLLDAMLAAVDLRRGEDVYIANAVKCRPPGNRTPEADELAACFPYLRRQIELIQPELIVLLGRVAVNSVLGQDASLSSLRGKALSYRTDGREIPVVVTYHPAYLLRNLPDKAKAWEDLCRARALMRKLKSR
ncbi:MAG: uracil-DNA glycosylase family protein [Propionivibrio sp.]